MLGQATVAPQAQAASTAVRRVGFWAALLTAAVTALQPSILNGETEGLALVTQ